VHKIILTSIVLILVLSDAWAQSLETKLANEYYMQGDIEKAQDLYQRLAKKREYIPDIHSNYLNLLIDRSSFEDADKYLGRVLKFYPGNLQYQSDFIYLLGISNRLKEKEEYVRSLLKIYQKNQYQLNLIAQNLSNRELYDDAILFLKTARKANGNPRSYSLDLAAIYRQKDDKAMMTEEYLNYAMANPGNSNYIKNVFQSLLAEPDDLNFLESTLIKKIQRQPNQLTYVELLIWVELQRKNFYGAFIQSRALDKRLNKAGDESMRIGQIALDNSAWEDAIDIFDYVIKEYPSGYHYPHAKQLRILATERFVKSQYPIDPLQIRSLTFQYQALYDEIGPTPVSLDALRNKALLHAFYLEEMDSAIFILNKVITSPRITPDLIANCKLNLGDIYLLTNDPWEASLMYSQVEKANKYASVAYRAKLKNAKLHYFTGNFALAKSHLDVLKQATTKEISNDAIDLGLLINNNTVFDTTDSVMQVFASIELQRYQHKEERASKMLIQLINDNPGHSIIDECYWLLADISMKKGQFQESIAYLDSLLKDYSDDILADDAFYTKALITQENIGDIELAKSLYREFLDLYPGSIYVAEARKRFRLLRGDLIN
jgi:tetratricopeptide (TPR) repeat protein